MVIKGELWGKCCCLTGTLVPVVGPPCICIDDLLPSLYIAEIAGESGFAENLRKKS